MKKWRLAKNRYIHIVSPEMFTAADKLQFHTNWTKVSCRQGNACIILPLLPYGSTGPATIIWQTLLSWYIAVKKDLMTLKTKESRLFQDIAKAYQSLEMPLAFLLSHTYCYSITPFWFPTVVELTNLGMLSDALVCQW